MKSHIRLMLVLAVSAPFLLISSAADAYNTYLTTRTTIYDYNQDYADGYLGNYLASSIRTELGSTAFAQSALTSAGVDLRTSSDSLAGPISKAQATLREDFILDTVSGTENAVLDAVMNFNLSGNYTWNGNDSAQGSFILDIGLYQLGAFWSLVSNIDIDARVEGSASGMIFTNYGDNYLLLYSYCPSGICVDQPLSLNISGLKADTQTRVEINMYTEAVNFKVDFANTLITDPDNPFAITNNPSGSTLEYTAETYGDDTFSLLGHLAGEELNVVPIPGALWLLGSGLIGIVGIRRKFKK